MIVTPENFPAVLVELQEAQVLSLDTETLGLRIYQQDRMFSLIIGIEDRQFYFNFQDYYSQENWEVDRAPALDRVKTLSVLQGAVFYDPRKKWYIHNAKFDMGTLHREGLYVLGEIHCTQALGRVIYNEHMDYSLAASAERIGLQKDDKVEDYINEHGLWEWEQVPGKKTRTKRKHFDRVPFDIVSKYGETDAAVGYRVGRGQEAEIADILNRTPEGAPSILRVFENEKKFTKTCFQMERTGVLIDVPYCDRAILFEDNRWLAKAYEFEQMTGLKFKDSNKLLEQAFSHLGESFPLTEKGNPSFTGEVLKEFDSPVAKLVMDLRDAHSKANYYRGFLYYKDDNNRVHPNIRQSGTATGRTSLSDPNFQNLTKEDSEEDLKKEFLVRRAIIPTPGFFFYCPDQDQVEYRLMLELAARRKGEMTPLIAKVLSGLDVHEACAQVATQYGYPITRDQAKTVNFLTLYGGGIAKLAKALKCTPEIAREIQNAIFQAAPEIKQFIRAVIDTASHRGFIYNWLGRRSHFPDSRFAYKAPNYLIQGGCADVMKVAQNRIADFLEGRKSRMLVQVHDELLFEIHETEEHLCQEIKVIMEGVFPSQYLPLTVSNAYATLSWADKIDGEKTRDSIQSTHCPPAAQAAEHRSLSH